jgi:hypothetical protein
MPRRSSHERVCYRLKVTIRGIRPPIWRRLEVDGALTLAKLHEVLQIAFGWTDSHLHQFVAQGVTYGEPHPDYEWEVRDERKVRLRDVLTKVRERMIYEYDFGDDWQHEIVLEAIEPRVAGVRLPRCVAGRRHGPPEDVGGPPGYAHLLQVLREAEHPEREEFLEWLGGEDFDPDAFDAAEVTAHLVGR